MHSEGNGLGNPYYIAEERHGMSSYQIPNFIFIEEICGVALPATGPLHISHTYPKTSRAPDLSSFLPHLHC